MRQRLRTAHLAAAAVVGVVAVVTVVTPVVVQVAAALIRPVRQHPAFR
jgi:hypothetical protein